MLEQFQVGLVRCGLVVVSIGPGGVDCFTDWLGFEVCNCACTSILAFLVFVSILAICASCFGDFRTHSV